MNITKGFFRLIGLFIGLAVIGVGVPLVVEWGSFAEDSARWPELLGDYYGRFFATFREKVLGDTGSFRWIMLGIIGIAALLAVVYVVRGFTDPMGAKIRKRQAEVAELKRKMAGDSQ